jgi:hypothetical protein
MLPQFAALEDSPADKAGVATKRGESYGRFITTPRGAKPKGFCHRNRKVQRLRDYSFECFCLRSSKEATDAVLGETSTVAVGT